ncbi:MAG TPA: hypothetical protein VGO47_10495 [Chlamydiales bacterium]|nr:hypothetical protein [Chlamydiales bacterium]
MQGSTTKPDTNASGGPSTAAIVTHFNKILNQPKLQRSNRSNNDILEGAKRLRRLILVEGIPSSVVRGVNCYADAVAR